MRIFDKIKKIPFRLNRQTFFEDNSHISNLQLVTDKDKYFMYMTDIQRVNLKREVMSQVRNIESTKKIVAHTYWYGEIGRKQVFSIKSFLATQDLNRVEVWLWLDAEKGYDNYENNVWLKEIMPFIKIKCYDPVNELKKIKCVNKIIFTQNFNLPYRADGFRLLTLYKYGGLYFDLDICFLDDLTRLCDNREWCYAWEKQAYANNALLYFKSGNESSLMRYLFKKAKRKAPMPWTVFRYSDRKLKNLTVYPYQLFDPAWLRPDGVVTDEYFDDFFMTVTPPDKDKIKSYKDFYPGALAYHWHNRWSLVEEENSYFCVFEKEFQNILEKKKEAMNV